MPYCNPSITFPSLSPAVTAFSISLPIRLQSATAETGITLDAPLYKAVAMVDVALKTSIITTMESFKSYKCKRAGERTVKFWAF